MDTNPEPTNTFSGNGSITLVPAGGLGNRMKAIAAALRLAESCGSRLRVVWFKDWGLGCRFDQLFQPISHERLSMREATLADQIADDRPRRRNLFLPRLILALRYDRRMDEAGCTHAMNTGFDFDSWARGRRVWMSSNVYFLAQEIPDDAFDLFRPTPRLQARIDEVAAQLGPNAVGVHIRRTDNARSIACSPTELFVERMRREPADTQFYVASDDEGVKAQLRREFSGRVTTLPRQAERGTLAGMEDGVVEMYVLARCRRLLGSSCSTYSMTAASLGRTPLEIIERRQP